MYILAGSTGHPIAKDIANALKEPLVKTTIKRFPDDELYVRIHDDIADESLLIVQTTYPDAKIIELLLWQNAAREAGAKQIITVIPYFGYSRQDKQFEPGEPISAKALAEHISLSTDRICTIDPHKEYLLDFFKKPAISCSAIPAIADYLKTKDIDFILAPDKGAQKKAEQAAKQIGCKSDYLEKRRLDGTTVEIKTKTLDITGKKVAIIDDIISTGGTMAKAIGELKKQGAKEVRVACTHGLFIDNAKKKLRNAGCTEIIATDTIKNEYSKVKTAYLLIKSLIDGETILPKNK